MPKVKLTTSDLTNFPVLSGNNNKVLSIDGSGNLTWITPASSVADLQGFPSQTGNAGKVLTTNGTSLSWTDLRNISISGPASITSFGNYTYTITDFDDVGTYSVSTNIGTVSRSGATITLTLGTNTDNGGGTSTVNLIVTRNGFSIVTNISYTLPNIAVTGPASITSFGNYTYTIADFDDVDTYSVSTNIGTVSRSGATITLTVASIPTPADGNLVLTVTRNGFSNALTVATYSFIPVTNGAAYGGGYLLKTATFNNKFYIVSPKSTEVTRQWKTTNTATSGTASTTDGLANSNAMNNTTHPAANYCRTLTTGDYTDWYLPAKDELNYLYVNRANMPSDQGFVSGFYWSSTEYSSTDAWVQFFGSGNPDLDFKASSGYVRAVRSINALGLFYQGGYIIGQYNGFMYIVSPKSTEQLHSWQGAINYCSSLNIDGHTDWYLPAIAEISFLYQNRANMPSGQGFVSSGYWSSTEYSSTRAWYQSFSGGNQSNDVKTNSWYVRAVRRIAL